MINMQFFVFFSAIFLIIDGALSEDELDEMLNDSILSTTPENLNMKDSSNLLVEGEGNADTHEKKLVKKRMNKKNKRKRDNGNIDDNLLYLEDDGYKDDTIYHPVSKKLKHDHSGSSELNFNSFNAEEETDKILSMLNLTPQIDNDDALYRNKQYNTQNYQYQQQPQQKPVIHTQHQQPPQQLVQQPSQKPVIHTQHQQLQQQLVQQPPQQQLVQQPPQQQPVHQPSQQLVQQPAKQPPQKQSIQQPPQKQSIQQPPQQPANQFVKNNNLSLKNHTVSKNTQTQHISQVKQAQSSVSPSVLPVKIENSNKLANTPKKVLETETVTVKIPTTVTVEKVVGTPQTITVEKASTRTINKIIRTKAKCPKPASPQTIHDTIYSTVTSSSKIETVTSSVISSKTVTSNIVTTIKSTFTSTITHTLTIEKKVDVCVSSQNTCKKHIKRAVYLIFSKIRKHYKRVHRGIEPPSPDSFLKGYFVYLSNQDRKNIDIVRKKIISASRTSERPSSKIIIHHSVKDDDDDDDDEHTDDAKDSSIEDVTDDVNDLLKNL